MKTPDKRQAGWVGCMAIFAALLITHSLSAEQKNPKAFLDRDLKTQITPLFTGEAAFRARLEAIASKTPGREPLGLLLSGGSARAYAHIGVLKRLEEADIVPDFIVANSMGAIVALLYAAGFSPDDIERIITITPLEELFKPVIPLRGGILDPGHFADIMGDLFGDDRVEDLAIPTLIVCDDLVSKRQVWLTEGPLVETFLAAFSMPMYFPPVPKDDLLLVDGGTSNLIPAAVPAAFTSRFIVAATFYEGRGLNFHNPLTIINRNFSTGKERAAIASIEESGGLLIRCAVEEFSFMDYSQIDRIIGAGYQSTACKTPEILRIIGKNPKDLSKLRARRRESLLKTERKISLGRSPKHHSSRATLAGSLTLPDSFSAAYRLEPESTLDLKLKLESGYVDADLGAWTGLERPGFGASARLTVSPPGPFAVSSGYSWCPEWSWAQGNIAARTFLSEDYILEGSVGAEFVFDPEYRVDDQWMTSGIRILPLGDGDRISQTAALFAFARSEASGSYTLGAEGRFGTRISLLGPLELRTGLLGRWSPVYRHFNPFRSDPWRGPSSESVRLPYLLANGEIALSFRDTGISLAESFQIPRIDLAVYTDILLSFVDRHLASGVSLSASVSLIGLSSVSASLYAGRDWQDNNYFWAIRLGMLW